MPTQTVEEARRELTRWTDDAQIILARISRVFDEHETLRVELEASHAEIAGRREQIAALEAEGTDLRGQVATHETLGIQLRDRIASLEADNAAFRTRLEALQARHGELAQLVAAGLRGVLDRVLSELPHGAALDLLPAPTAAPPGPIEAPAAAATGDPPAPPAPVGAPAPLRATATEPEPGPAPAPFLASMPDRGLDAGWPEPELDAELALDEAVRAGVLGDAADDDPARLAIEQHQDEDPRDAGELPTGPAPEELTRIMLVDDEPHFTELIAEFLAGRGFDVRMASTGEHGLEVLSEFRPRIVLLDLMMPGMGGMETLRRIKAAQPETSVIMVTAIDDRDTARKALALGASDYVTKPLTLDFLESVLAVHVPGALPVPMAGDGEHAQSMISALDSAPSFFARR